VRTRKDVPTRWLTTAEAASYLKLSPKTLEKMRALGQGPRWHRPDDGRTVRYDIADLDAWMLGEGGER
jgi:excisionase family DNA binding protein